MSNTYITPDIIAKEAIMHMKNELVFGNLVHRGYSKEFKKVGNTISIRKPNRLKSIAGADITNNINQIEESSVDLTLSQRVVPMEFGSKDLTLTIDEFSARYIQPAVGQLANDVDADGANLYKQVFNAAGTAGSTPNSFSDLGAAAKKLDKFGVPRGDRNMVLDPDATWEIADALKGLYLEKEVRKMIANGQLGRIANMGVYGDQNIATHSAGTAAGSGVVALDSDISAGSTGKTYLTSNNNAETSTLYTDGWTASTAVLTEGDIITIDNVYAVNPKNRSSIGDLQQFVVRSAVTADSSGYASITVAPAIVTSSDNEAYQTVDAAPAENATINFITTDSVNNLAFHKNAFALATAQLEVLPGCEGSTVLDADTGISVRYMRDGDIKTDTAVHRLDILYGWKCINPYFACRLFG